MLSLAEHDELRRLRRENEQLRMEREILKRRRSSLRKKSNKIRFYSRAKKTYPVTMLCRMMNVSQSAYYAWNESTPKRQQREQEEMMVANKLRQLFNDNRCVYGSRRLTNILKTQGFR